MTNFKIFDDFRLRLLFFNTQRIQVRLPQRNFFDRLRLRLPTRIRKIVAKRMSLRLNTHLCYLLPINNFSSFIYLMRED